MSKKERNGDYDEEKKIIDREQARKKKREYSGGSDK